MIKMIEMLEQCSENDMYHRIYDMSEDMNSIEFHELMLSIIRDIKPAQRGHFLAAYARWQENENELNRVF